MNETTIDVIMGVSIILNFVFIIKLLAHAEREESLQREIYYAKEKNKILDSTIGILREDVYKRQETIEELYVKLKLAKGGSTAPNVPSPEESEKEIDHIY